LDCLREKAEDVCFSTAHLAICLRTETDEPLDDNPP
jgi:hypothetical protein